jgi:DNA helicase-2/ATP-dependent DNA helicase PcrA
MMPNWSPQQEAIFSWFSNPHQGGKKNLLVRARAGTGKTTTIIEAIERDKTHGKILLAAFNKVIAEELKNRLKNPRAQARTLHSMGNYFCTKNWGRALKIDESRGRRIVRKLVEGSGTSPEVIKLITKLAGLGKNIAPFATEEKLIEIAYDFELLPPEEGDATWTVEDIAGTAAEAMKAAAENDGTIDYDDMIWLPVRKHWVFPFMDLVVIDEAQDMNATQLSLAMGLCKRGGNIVVVGDDRQAIYGFRGADSNALDRLKTELCADELPLNITYRCPRRVVELASEIVPDFTAAPTAPEGTVDALGASRIVETPVPGDFILSRTNAPLAKICLSMLRANKRAVIRGRDIGKQLSGLVRKMEADDLPELALRIKNWEISTIDILTKAEAADSSIEYVSDQAETVIALSEGLASIPELEARLETLFSDNCIGEAVICSSIHKAKGLEAHRVFLLIDTLYPGKNRPDYVEHEEEANIHYVGLTRAKSHLTLVEGRP